MDNYSVSEQSYKNGISYCIRICEEFKNDISERFNSYSDAILASNIDAILSEIIYKMKQGL